MKRPRIQRRIVVGGLVVFVAVVLAILALDRPSTISGFRVADDRTLVVTAQPDGAAACGTSVRSSTRASRLGVPGRSATRSATRSGLILFTVI